MSDSGLKAVRGSVSDSGLDSSKVIRCDKSTLFDNSAYFYRTQLEYSKVDLKK